MGCKVEVTQCSAVVLTLSLPITYLLTYGAEPFLRSRQLCSHSLPITVNINKAVPVYS
jgi:hypothetical protein